MCYILAVHDNVTDSITITPDIGCKHFKLLLKTYLFRCWDCGALQLLG